MYNNWPNLPSFWCLEEEKHPSADRYIMRAPFASNSLKPERKGENRVINTVIYLILNSKDFWHSMDSMYSSLILMFWRRIIRKVCPFTKYIEHHSNKTSPIRAMLYFTGISLKEHQLFFTPEAAETVPPKLQRELMRSAFS